MIFLMTATYSMDAMIRIAPLHDGQISGMVRCIIERWE